MQAFRLQDAKMTVLVSETVTVMETETETETMIGPTTRTAPLGLLGEATGLLRPHQKDPSQNQNQNRSRSQSLVLRLRLQPKPYSQCEYGRY
jgi:hypothetical protein